jgi:hypothetical protein
MVDFLNPIAELDHPDSGIILKPEGCRKYRDEGRQFFCPDPECIDPNRILRLVVRSNGTIFFRHEANCGHSIQSETLLHKLSVRWFEKREQINLPLYQRDKFYLPPQVTLLDPMKTKCEYRKLERHIPDVRLVTTNGFEFAIEIVVTSDISNDKNKLIHDFGLPTLRINLSTFYKENSEKCRTDYDFVVGKLDSLLGDVARMNWIIPPNLEEVNNKLEMNELQTALEVSSPSKLPKQPPNSGCMLILFTLGLSLIFAKS